MDVMWQAFHDESAFLLTGGVLGAAWHRHKAALVVLSIYP